jgi:hypothetical protein
MLDQHFDELCIGLKSKVLKNINFHWLGLKTRHQMMSLS